MLLECKNKEKNIYQDIEGGINFTMNISKNILMTKKDKLMEKVKKYKPLIYDYLKTKKEATTLQIARKFGLKYEEAHFILIILNKEGKIVIS